MVKLQYFADVRTRIGLPGEEIELPEGVTTIDDLRRHLVSLGGGREVLENCSKLRIACNTKLVRGDSPVADGDELSIFPFVSAG